MTGTPQRALLTTAVTFILGAMAATAQQPPAPPSPAAPPSTAPPSTTPPPSYSPPQQLPRQAAPAPDPAAGSDARNGTDTQADVNDCAAKVRAGNPRLTAVQIKQYCQRQLNPSSPQD